MGQFKEAYDIYDSEMTRGQRQASLIQQMNQLKFEREEAERKRLTDEATARLADWDKRLSEPYWWTETEGDEARRGAAQFDINSTRRTLGLPELDSLQDTRPTTVIADLGKIGPMAQAGVPYEFVEKWFTGRYGPGFMTGANVIARIQESAGKQAVTTMRPVYPPEFLNWWSECRRRDPSLPQDPGDPSIPYDIFGYWQSKPQAKMNKPGDKMPLKYQKNGPGVPAEPGEALTPQEETQFQAWWGEFAPANGLNANPDNEASYDWRRYWKEWRPVAGKLADMNIPDKYKRAASTVAEPGAISNQESVETPAAPVANLPNTPEVDASPPSDGRPPWEMYRLDDPEHEEEVPGGGLRSLPGLPGYAVDQNGNLKAVSTETAPGPVKTPEAASRASEAPSQPTEPNLPLATPGTVQGETTQTAYSNLGEQPQEQLDPAPPQLPVPETAKTWRDGLRQIYDQFQVKDAFGESTKVVGMLKEDWGWMVVDQMPQYNGLIDQMAESLHVDPKLRRTDKPKFYSMLKEAMKQNEQENALEKNAVSIMDTIDKVRLLVMESKGDPEKAVQTIAYNSWPILKKMGYSATWGEYWGMMQAFKGQAIDKRREDVAKWVNIAGGIFDRVQAAYQSGQQDKDTLAARGALWVYDNMIATPNIDPMEIPPMPDGYARSERMTSAQIQAYQFDRDKETRRQKEWGQNYKLDVEAGEREEEKLDIERRGGKTPEEKAAAAYFIRDLPPKDREKYTIIGISPNIPIDAANSWIGQQLSDPNGAITTDILSKKWTVVDGPQARTVTDPKTGKRVRKTVTINGRQKVIDFNKTAGAGALSPNAGPAGGQPSAPAQTASARPIGYSHKDIQSADNTLATVRKRPGVKKAERVVAIRGAILTRLMRLYGDQAGIRYMSGPTGIPAQEQQSLLAEIRQLLAEERRFKPVNDLHKDDNFWRQFIRDARKGVINGVQQGRAFTDAEIHLMMVENKWWLDGRVIDLIRGVK